MIHSLLIGTPCLGGLVTNRYTQSILKLQMACHERKDARLHSVAQWGDSLITRARQGIVTHFLAEPSATHLLFMDGATGFEPEQVFRLLEFDEDVTAAGMAVPGGYSFEAEGPPRIIRNGFVKSRFAGTDLMLVKRPALESMVAQYPRLRYKNELGTGPEDPRYWSYALFNCLLDAAEGKFLSEDFSFCRRWTDMGGEIWVDPPKEKSGMLDKE